MGRMPLATCLWPGLPQLWRTGERYGLALACGFALLLNVGLLASLAWSELFTREMRIGVWVAVAVVWCVSAVLGCRFIWRRSADDRLAIEQDEFGEAQDHYLKGDWFQTQRILGDLLRRNPRDLEARLMLATMLRHTGQLNDAAGQLDQIALLEHSRRWVLEINHEKHLLADAQRRRQRGNRTDPAEQIEPPNGDRNVRAIH